MRSRWKSNLTILRIAHVVWAPLLSPLFLVGKLVPRRRDLWVFGNVKGYADNSRYLFEYVRRQGHGIEAVWLARNPRLVAQVRSAGGCAYLLSSPRGIWTAFRAGVGVVTNGLSDINRGAAGGMALINLWHGTPLKRLLLDFEDDTKTVRGRFLRWLASRPLSQANRRYAVVTAASDVAAERLASAFGLPAERIAVTGQPRADAILGDGNSCRLRKRLGLVQEDRLVLYAPTWRETLSRPWEGVDRSAWDGLLNRFRAHLLIKPHPYTSIASMRDHFSGADRIRVLSPDDCPDINEVLHEVDILITDYSSVAFDFALLERPILFFAPDHDAYRAGRGFYEPYLSFTGGNISRDWVDLGNRVEAVLSCRDLKPLATSRRINNRYNAFHDTRNCERVLEVIQKAVA